MPETQGAKIVADTATTIHPAWWAGLAVGLTKVAEAGFKWASKLRSGHQEKSNPVMEALTRIESSVQRVEGKIDRHIEAHAEGKF